MQHYMPNLRLVTTDGEANVSPPAPTPFILDATSLRPRPRRPITGRRPLGLDGRRGNEQGISASAQRGATS